MKAESTGGLGLFCLQKWDLVLGPLRNDAEQIADFLCAKCYVGFAPQAGRLADYLLSLEAAVREAHADWHDWVETDQRRRRISSNRIWAEPFVRNNCRDGRAKGFLRCPWPSESMVRHRAKDAKVL